MSIEQIINKNPIVCTEAMSLTDVYQLMRESESDCVVVVKSYAHRKPLGIVTEREICLEVIGKARQPRVLTAGSVMNTNVLKAPRTISVADCARSMQANQMKWTLVVNEDDTLCGTVRDVDVERIERQSGVYVAPQFFSDQNYYKLNRIY